MSSSSSKTKASNEEVLNQKLDVCLSNALVKTGLGFVAGSALSLILFKRRAYPIWLATGFGVGSGYSDCQRLYTPLTLPGLRVLPSTSSSPPAAQAGVLEKLSDKAGNAIASSRKDLEPHLEKAKDVIQDKASQVKSDLSEKARDVVEAAQEKAVEIKDRAVGGANEVKDKAISPTGEVRSTSIPSMLESSSSANYFPSFASLFLSSSSSSPSLPSPSSSSSSSSSTSASGGVSPSSSASSAGYQDCLTCRLTGTLTMLGLGSYSFLEAHRAGAFSRPHPRPTTPNPTNNPPSSSPAAAAEAAKKAAARMSKGASKPQPVRGTLLALFGIAAYGGAIYRWTL